MLFHCSCFHDTVPRKMIEKSWEWAKAKGPDRFRTNEVHGEEEIKITLFQSFDKSNAHIEEVNRSGTIASQEGFGNSMHGQV